MDKIHNTSHGCEIKYPQLCYLNISRLLFNDKSTWHNYAIVSVPPFCLCEFSLGSILHLHAAHKAPTTDINTLCNEPSAPPLSSCDEGRLSRHLMSVLTGRKSTERRTEEITP